MMIDYYYIFGLFVAYGLTLLANRFNMIPKTPKDLEILVEEWEIKMETEFVTVDVNKPNGIDGRPLKMEKKVPPLIETFLLNAYISTKEWARIRNDAAYAEYEAHAQRVTDVCNAKILEMTALGMISDNMGKFYLVNNSRYKDVSEVIQTTTTKVLPSWITSRVQIQETDKSKGLPHESIPFVEVTNGIDDLL